MARYRGLGRGGDGHRSGSDVDDIKESLRSFILSEFLPGESAGNLRDDTPLVSSGILDSLKVLQLVSRIEDDFAVIVEPHETEKLDTINSIVRLIESKR